MEVKIKKVFEDAVVPTRGSAQAAGYDLYAYKPGDKDAVYIQPHTTLMVHTGVEVEIPEGYFGGIFARSGIAKNRGLLPANAVGVVDSDFRSEIMVALHNNSNEMQLVSHGERIAQLVVIPYLPVEFAEVYELSDTERGAGGFGSTGV